MRICVYALLYDVAYLCLCLRLCLCQCVSLYVRVCIRIYTHTHEHTHTHTHVNMYIYIYVQGGVEVDVGYVAVPIQRVSRAGKEDGWYELRTIDDEVRMCV